MKGQGAAFSFPDHPDFRKDIFFNHLNGPGAVTEDTGLLASRELHVGMCAGLRFNSKCSNTSVYAGNNDFFAKPRLDAYLKFLTLDM